MTTHVNPAHKKIKSIKKIGLGKYLLNEHIILKDLDVDESGIVYNLTFNETEVTEDEATLIAEEFITSALKNEKT